LYAESHFGYNYEDTQNGSGKQLFASLNEWNESSCWFDKDGGKETDTTGIGFLRGDSISQNDSGNITIREVYDITDQVRYWIETPDENLGMFLDFTEYDRGVKYASSDHPDTALRPRLIIEYEGDVGAVFLDRSSDGEGSIASEPEKTIFTEGTEVVLRPRPDMGYAFSHWSGDLSGNDTVVTLTMDSNKSVTAHFEHAPQYTLTLSAENGKITATPDKDYYSAGEEVLLRAEPDSGYVFSEWNGDLAGNEYFIAHVSMDSNREIGAYFPQHNYIPDNFHDAEVRLHSVSSEAPDYPAENVLSGDPDEFWLTQEGEETGPPHEIVFRINQPMCGGTPVGGLLYTPRQDSEEGRICEYELYHSESADTEDWGAPLDAGRWENSDGPQETAYAFAERYNLNMYYLRLVILSEVSGGSLASAANIELLMDTANTVSIIEHVRPDDPCVLYGSVLSIAEETPLRVRLSSVSGRQLKTISTVGAKEIDLGNLGLSPGIYILQVQDLAGNINMHRTVYIR
jgi:hypothetical protein